jgi:hypothetical protein
MIFYLPVIPRIWKQPHWRPAHSNSWRSVLHPCSDSGRLTALLPVLIETKNVLDRRMCQGIPLCHHNTLYTRTPEYPYRGHVQARHNSSGLQFWPRPFFFRTVTGLHPGAGISSGFRTRPDFFLFFLFFLPAVQTAFLGPKNALENTQSRMNRIITLRQPPTFSMDIGMKESMSRRQSLPDEHMASHFLPTFQSDWYLAEGVLPDRTRPKGSISQKFFRTGTWDP